MAKLSGGGITSNKNVNKPVKSGSPVAQKISPSAVSEMGNKVFQNPSPLVEGTMKQVELGNQCTMGTNGPGVGRTNSKAGSQGNH